VLTVERGRRVYRLRQRAIDGKCRGILAGCKSWMIEAEIATGRWAEPVLDGGGRLGSGDGSVMRGGIGPGGGDVVFERHQSSGNLKVVSLTSGCNRCNVAGFQAIFAEVQYPDRSPIRAVICHH